MSLISAPSLLSHGLREKVGKIVGKIVGVSCAVSIYNNMESRHEVFFSNFQLGLGS